MCGCVSVYACVHANIDVCAHMHAWVWREGAVLCIAWGKPLVAAFVVSGQAPGTPLLLRGRLGTVQPSPECPLSQNHLSESEWAQEVEIGLPVNSVDNLHRMTLL